MQHNQHQKSGPDERIDHIHSKVREIKLHNLKFYGFLHCDITNYEHYTVIEVINDFCEVVPCFFRSYSDLNYYFTNQFEECNSAMIRLRVDLLLPPRAATQSQMVTIIHDYFISLPWIG